MGSGRRGAYNYPRNVHIVDALPRGPTGKILNREITVTVAPRTGDCWLTWVRI
jgi:long-chain acyl-CoA synthetase